MSWSPPPISVRYPTRAVTWQLMSRSLRFDRPLVMGIVNVTPDSFSDGGKFMDPSAATDHALALIADGADLIDIGGESTRPYSVAIDADEECRRVLPVVEMLCRQASVPVSIDTSKAMVAARALECGAEIVNDVTGLSGDPLMTPLVAAAGAGVVAMHMQGTPQTMQDRPHYDDVVAEVEAHLAARRDALAAANVALERICLDPGIGFGKTNKHNLTLMAHLGRLHSLGCPVLAGPSRKAFLGKILGDMDADRTAATVGAALAAAAQGVQVIRVHDVRPLRDALAAFGACGGLDPIEPE